MSQQYGTARSLLSFAEFIAWIGILAGVAFALFAFDKGLNSIYGGNNVAAGVIASMPGAAIAFMGIIVVAFVQMGRAAIDTAEMTKELVTLNRRHLEIASSSYGLFQRASEAAKTSGPQAKAPWNTPHDRSDDQVAPSQQPLDSNGLDQEQVDEKSSQLSLTNKPGIEIGPGGYFVDGRRFRTVQAAIEYRDSLG